MEYQYRTWLVDKIQNSRYFAPMFVLMKSLGGYFGGLQKCGWLLRKVAAAMLLSFGS